MNLLRSWPGTNRKCNTINKSESIPDFFFNIASMISCLPCIYVCTLFKYSVYLYLITHFFMSSHEKSIMHQQGQEKVINQIQTCNLSQQNPFNVYKMYQFTNTTRTDHSMFDICVIVCLTII